MNAKEIMRQNQLEKIRLIALDLDETTLDAQGHLSPATRRALHCAMDRGIVIVVATGRPLGSIPEEVTRFPGLRYAITSNGAAVYDMTTGQCLQRYLLPAEAVKTILARTRHMDLTYEVFIRGTAYAQTDYIQDPTDYMADSKTRQYIRETRHGVPDIRAFAYEHRQELDSMDLVVKCLEQKAQARARLTDLQGVYITTSVPRLLELSHRDSGKHRALQRISAALGVPQEATAAFGNADNDAEMLKWAGIGVAVENASALCREAADYVTGPYWRDAVALAFQTLLHISD